MRLGKEQAVGVVEVPEGADSVIHDQPVAGEADQERSVEEVVEATSPVSEQGALIRSR